MPRMVSGKRPTVKTALRRLLKLTNDKRLSIRIRIVLMNFGCQKISLIAETVGCSTKTVRRVVDRFVEHSIAGLYDRREDNGGRKLDESYLAQLKEMVDQSPRDFGYFASDVDPGVVDRSDGPPTRCSRPPNDDEPRLEND